MKEILTYGLLLFSFLSFAQEKEKDKYLPKGNDEFADKNYVDAEADYRISQSKSPTKSIASYNLGNAIYRQKMPSEAKISYLKAIENAKTKQEKHLAFHNLGNTLMEEKNYQGAVEAYKNALRNNPYDEETRYNYALAKKFLKDNPPPKQDNKDDKKDKNKDKQDNKSQKPKDNKGDQKDKDKGDGNKDKKDKGDNKQEKPKEGKDKDNKGGGNGQDGQSGASKQRIENMLDALNNEEKKIQDKVNMQKVKTRPVKQEKDW